MDAAAATPLRPEVRDRMQVGLESTGNPGALHMLGVEAKRLLEEARTEAAQALGAHADEIVFTGSGTESNNLAIFGLIEALEEKDIHIVTVAIEHPSVLEPIRALQRRGVAVTVLPVLCDGRVDMDVLGSAITEKTRLISVGLVNSEIGVVQDVRAIAKIIRNVRASRGNSGAPLYLHTDAAQAPLWMKLKVEELHPDLLTLDAQKIAGPKGSGLLFVRRKVPLRPQLLGGGQERGLRSGTENVAAALAVARALTLAFEDCEANTARIAAVRDTLLAQIEQQIPGTTVHGSKVHRVANNLNISIPGLIGERAVLALSAWGIDASTRSACATKDEDLSPVIRALYRGEEGAAHARTAVRFSLLPNATISEASVVASKLFKAAKQYRNIDA